MDELAKIRINHLLKEEKRKEKRQGMIIICVVLFLFIAFVSTYFIDYIPRHIIRENIEITTYKPLPSASKDRGMVVYVISGLKWTIEEFDFCENPIRIKYTKGVKLDYAKRLINSFDCGIVKNEHIYPNLFIIQLYEKMGGWCRDDSDRSDGCYSNHHIKLHTSMNEERFLSVLYHEYSHHLWGVDSQFINQSYWKKLHSETNKFITPYAKKNANENFAETFSELMMENKVKDLKKVEFMKEYIERLRER